MKKYFFNDGTAQQGPFDLKELKSKNITAETPVWYEGLPEWTTAGKLEDLNEIFIPVPPPFNAVLPPAPIEATELVTPVVAEPVITVSTEPVVEVTSTATAITVPAATAAISSKVATTAKKSTAWLSWVLTILVLGGAGYFVYQDMEKNKTSGSSSNITTVLKTDTTATIPLSQTESPRTDTSTATVATTVTDTTAITITKTTTPPTTTTVATNTTAQQVAAQKAATKKAEEEKKKQLALAAQKKAEADKKKLEAAQAATAAREMDMRNRWSKYITIGNLSYETKGDGIKPFDVPVYNGTDAPLDKVTLRIEYLKKNDRKIFKTETITVYNIPARGGVNGKAPESKKGEKVNVFITGINSRRLHFCYPQGNGSPTDPYFCN